MRKFREMIFSGGNKGFTLIELLVVIAVLGILAGIAIPRLTGVRDEALYASGKSTLKTLSNYITMYETQYGTTSASIDTVIAKYTDKKDLIDMLSSDENWTSSSGSVAINSSSTSITINSNGKTMSLTPSDGSITPTDASGF
ncbi:type II secretion system protein [Halanaerobium congolense]|uniref:Prepilin-type N-terminal cleavage/methylation domain-containing protein n=1 Tax=Halanaerobium congolense TaxID=54121 RepID=A0A1G6HWI2_9FIRM|nr:prepilin-type N-terminal cleavage/methylation domain-containing protein [Halanaerobium congolense]SDB98564.1 prepilin-type N-terminal cleavage/methylation domain-containing protein [Halanaerobium congolense]